MPTSEGPHYRSEGARKTALLTKIRTLAPQRGLSPQALRREYVLQRFLALLFAAQPSPWVLKGGSGLLIRLPGARHSEDIDLLDARGDLHVALDELRALCQDTPPNPFHYTLTPVAPMTGHAEGTTVKSSRPWPPPSSTGSPWTSPCSPPSTDHRPPGPHPRSSPSATSTRPHPSRSTPFPPKSPTR